MNGQPHPVLTTLNKSLHYITIYVIKGNHSSMYRTFFHVKHVGHFLTLTSANVNWDKNNQI